MKNHTTDAANESSSEHPSYVRLSKADVARTLCIGERTLDKLVAQRKFPPGVRFGRFLYWSEQAVLKWQGSLFEAQMAWHP